MDLHTSIFETSRQHFPLILDVHHYINWKRKAKPVVSYNTQTSVALEFQSKQNLRIRASTLAMPEWETI